MGSEAPNRDGEHRNDTPRRRLTEGRRHALGLRLLLLLPLELLHGLLVPPTRGLRRGDLAVRGPVRLEARPVLDPQPLQPLLYTHRVVSGRVVGMCERGNGNGKGRRLVVYGRTHARTHRATSEAHMSREKRYWSPFLHTQTHASSNVRKIEVRMGEHLLLDTHIQHHLTPTHRSPRFSASSSRSISPR